MAPGAALHGGVLAVGEKERRNVDVLAAHAGGGLAAELALDGPLGDAEGRLERGAPAGRVGGGQQQLPELGGVPREADLPGLVRVHHEGDGDEGVLQELVSDDADDGLHNTPPHGASHRARLVQHDCEDLAPAGAALGQLGPHAAAQQRRAVHAKRRVSGGPEEGHAAASRRGSSGILGSAAQRRRRFQRPGRELARFDWFRSGLLCLGELAH
mmetsp:Transcript_23982/g.69369  ORF Transcript_23982/g.69369 Transcript_23982/m.69369 type:complete len:213 (+) Transcript_23982:872-1510(+)